MKVTRCSASVLWSRRITSSLLGLLMWCGGVDQANGNLTSAHNISFGSMVSDETRTPPALTFSRIPAGDIQTSLLEWLARSGADEAVSRQVTALWADRELILASSAEDLLDRLIESFAVIDSATKRFRQQILAAELVEPPVFDGIRSDPFFRQNVELYHARWLTQHRYFDEALLLLEKLNPESSIDPAGLFFYRAVCQQKLLQQQAAADSLNLLLHNTLDVPARFRVVAEMMQTELRSQAESGLPEAARLMADIQRRLDLGRSGEKVQKQEDEVIAVLDKLLEDMNRQRNPQPNDGQGGSGGSENQPGSQGADQSAIKGSAAEGNADRKELTENGAWGMLDKQAETQARELIRQQFPSNYLDAISRYTKKIAERK